VSTVIKLKRTTTASVVPTTSDLEDGEIAINVTDKKIFVRNGGDIITVANFNTAGGDFTIADDTSTTTNISSGETLKILGTANEIETSISGDTLTIGLPTNVTIAGNLTANGNISLGVADAIDASTIQTLALNARVSTDILPNSTNTLSLGSSERRWKDLYLSGNTIDLAGATISSDGTGTISISASGATLPLNSNVQISGAVTKTIALAGADGSPVQAVPFFSNSGGLASQNTKLDFKADPDKIVASFTLNNGDVLGSAQGNTLFFF